MKKFKVPKISKKNISAVEDIYYLMNIPKRAPHPGKLSEFYKKLGIVFSRAKMSLFHACTQHKLFKLTRDMRKNLSQAGVIIFVYISSSGPISNRRYIADL